MFQILINLPKFVKIKPYIIGFSPIHKPNLFGWDMNSTHFLVSYEIHVAAKHYFFYFFLKIINWSSLDYMKTNLRNRWELDSIFGTAFDIVVHICMTYYLGQYLNVVQVTCSLTIVQVGIMLLLFGPYFAWANPSNIPAWVQKRLAQDKLKDPDVVPGWIFGRAGDSGNENKS